MALVKKALGPVLDVTFACNPATERGRGVLLGGCAKTNVVTYCNGKAVILRSLDDPTKADVYTEHSYATTVARVSPNGEWVASADVSGTVRVWGRREEHVLKFEIKALNGPVDDLQWSHDGQRIVVSGDSKSSLVRAFSWDSGVNLGEFDGHSKRVLSCAFRPIRPFRVMTGGEDMRVNYYEGPPFRFKSSDTTHSNFVNCVRYSPDGTLLLSVGSDKRGLLFKGATGELVGELGEKGKGAHAGSIYAASWSPDGKQVLTVSADKTAKIWNITPEGMGHLETTFSFGSPPTIDHMQVGCLWLGPHIITLSLSGDLSYLSPSAPAAPLRVLLGHTKEITAVVVARSAAHDSAFANGHSEGVEVVSGSYDGTLIKWRMDLGGSVGRLQGQGGVSIRSISASQGSLLVASLDNKVRQLPLSAESLAEGGEGTALGGQPQSISASSGDNSLSVAATSKGVVLLRGSSILSSTPLPCSAEPLCAAINPGGDEVAVGSSTGKVHIFAVRGDSLVEEAILERHRGPLTDLQYSPSGSMLASCDSNREAAVWDTVSRELKMKNLVYHTARVNCIAWSPSSELFATGSLDTNIFVYDINKDPSDRITIPKTHVGGVTGLAFLDESSVLSVGHDACVKVWALPKSS